MPASPTVSQAPSSAVAQSPVTSPAQTDDEDIGDGYESQEKANKALKDECLTDRPEATSKATKRKGKPGAAANPEAQRSGKAALKLSTTPKNKRKRGNGADMDAFEPAIERFPARLHRAVAERTPRSSEVIPKPRKSYRQSPPEQAPLRPYPPPGTPATSGMGQLAIGISEPLQVSSIGLREAFLRDESLGAIAEHLRSLPDEDRTSQSRNLLDGLEAQFGYIQWSALEVQTMLEDVNGNLEDVLCGQAFGERYPTVDRLSRAETDKRQRLKLFRTRYEEKWQNDRHVPQSFIEWAGSNASVSQKAGTMVSLHTASQAGLLITKHMIYRNIKKKTNSRLTDVRGERLKPSACDVNSEVIKSMMPELDALDFKDEIVKTLLDEEGMMINEGNWIVP